MGAVTSETSQPPTPVRRGRKRSQASRRAILDAAFELFGEGGFAALTIEGIAARAGCGKQTIYRWWPGKADVLLDALATKADMHIPVADQGSYQAELRSFLEESFVLSRRPQVGDVLCVLMAEAQTDPAFGARFQAAFLTRRREALSIILARATDRGDLPARPSPDAVLDIVFGVIWYRMLATRRPLDRQLADELLDLLTATDDPTPTGASKPKGQITR